MPVKKLISEYRHDDALPLYVAAFMMAICLSTWWTAMPFVLTSIGGNKAHAGYAPAINGLVYMVSLLVAGSFFHHLDVSKCTRTAVGVVFFSGVCVCGILFLAGAGQSEENWHWIWLVIVFSALGGAGTALYWPYLMSWVSADLEGRQLNNRFGRYNGSWSSGGLLGPFVAGWLLEINPLVTMIVATAFLIICFAMLLIARNARIQAEVFESKIVDVTIPYDREILLQFRWLSRIALFISWMSFSVVRSQFGLLLTDLGFSESHFGILMTIFGVFNFLIMSGAGKWDFWHFQKALLFVCDGMLVLSLLIVIYGGGMIVFSLASIIMGMAFGFSYSSHLYYGALGSRKRSARMVIHEMTISIGIIIGSAPAGYLCENVGLYVPYWFAIGLILIGTAGQCAIALKFKNLKTTT